MSTDVMLQEAIEAIRQGQRSRGRDLLTRLLRSNQNNPTYWLWMSSTVDTVKERAFCLQNVLRLDPENALARRGLVLIGAQPPAPDLQPVFPQRRSWQVQLAEPPPTGWRRIWNNPLLRIVFFIAVGVVVIGLILAGIFGLGRRAARIAARPTNTPGPPPTFTLTPTSIPNTLVALHVTASPTFSGPTPLWMLLEATYTPTPVYVNTPHPISEAYRLGQRAYASNDWTTALRFFTDASKVDSQAADIRYHIGETQRMMGNLEGALQAYQDALALDANFAPALLGRARVQRMLDPESPVDEDLGQAIQNDPRLAEAYLERAEYRLEQQDVEGALEDLESAEELLPDSPLVKLYRARVAMQLGDTEQALEYALTANRQDRTALPGYLILGQVALAAQDYELALQALETYILYAEDDPAGWLALGQAQAGIPGHLAWITPLSESRSTQGDEDALQSFERAIELDDELPEPHIYRALLLLYQDEGQRAVNELMVARRMDSKSFLINLALGRALLGARRQPEGYDQFDATEKLADEDAEMAALLYWRAQAAEILGRYPTALKDWQALLELPEGAALLSMLATAEEHIRTLTASPTPRLTATFTETSSPTASKTPTSTPTPTRRPSRTPTRTPTRTPSPAP